MYQHQIPPRRQPKNDNEYFEVLAQSVFQAGFSWQVVRSKWQNFKKAFRNFDVEKVAKFNSQDVRRMMNDAGIIRNARKINAVIENARIFREIQKEHGSFKKFIASLRKLPYVKRRTTLSKTFHWIGATGAFYFFWCVGEEVPEWGKRKR